MLCSRRTRRVHVRSPKEAMQAEADDRCKAREDWVRWCPVNCFRLPVVKRWVVVQERIPLINK